MAREMERALETDKLRAEVKAWADETGLLLSSCRILINYFGTDEEIASWDAAIMLPQRTLDFAVDALTDKINARADWQVPEGRDVHFLCSESVARIVSPLVEIIGVPLAEFVQTIRETIPKEDQATLLFPYGSFCGRFADAISNPLWKQYPGLAPDEWKDVYLKGPG